MDSAEVYLTVKKVAPKRNNVILLVSIIQTADSQKENKLEAVPKKKERQLLLSFIQIDEPQKENKLNAVPETKQLHLAKVIYSNCWASSKGKRA